MQWDPNPTAVEIFGIPIFWYGIFFALGFLLATPLFVRHVMLVVKGKYTKKEVSQSTDRLLLYLIIGLVLGARLGHFFFYEKPSFYLTCPWTILYLRQGGLASHGAVVGVLIALWIFQRRNRGVFSFLGGFRTLDLMSAPAALIGGMIRLGNFVNQELVGTVTSVPWAVTFVHPLDGSLPLPRHPVQLYEAISYFFLCWVFCRLIKQKSYQKVPGRLVGLFLICIFFLRFILETFKLEQSHLLGGMTHLTMGQILSLPMIALGIFFISRRRASK